MNCIRRITSPTNTYSGQSGLALAARLKALNVATLIVDYSPQIGQAWRERYDVSLIVSISVLDTKALKVY